ncbi:MAG: ATP-dependent Clp protease adaptor ClpS [Planctomycetota bacterium]
MNQAMVAPVADVIADVVESAARPRRQPPYAVVLHNDDVNGIGFVVETLMRVFRLEFAAAFELTVRAHETGRAVVWSGMREHAELKAEQVQSRGADPQARTEGAPRLTVSVEAMPG